MVSLKIIYVCGSAEPGKDGVGDYSRRMCGELIRKGHEVYILSLYDQFVFTFTIERQFIESTEVVVYRIPRITSKKKLLNLVQNIMINFKPDWISLQYVPYSYNIKGLPFWLPSFLKKIKGNYKWHIMFHELWLGIDIESSFRHKCIGYIQQRILQLLIFKIKPQIINTQNKLYQYFLQSLNINVDILPICSNIPLTAVKKDAKVYTQFVLFGTIHPGAPFKNFIDDLVKYKSKLTKPIKFIFIGNNGQELFNYVKVLESYDIKYEVIGIKTESIISQVLIDSDHGISTTPYFQTEKSGVYAAYKEHQINTICVSRSWTPTKGQYIIPNIIRYEKNNLNLIPVNCKALSVSTLANQFIKSISKL